VLAERDKIVIQRFKKLMLECGVPLYRIILFGSRARGDYHTDSDYDVLVAVTTLDSTIRRMIRDCAWEAGFEDCLVIVPVVVTQDEMEHTPFRSSLLMQAIREEGIPI
jgi:predicted nucleotidyltransferase